MKKYILFGGKQYYASGGWNDCVMSSDDLDECVQHFHDHKNGGYSNKLEWYHVVDTESGSIVRGTQKTPLGKAWELAEDHPDIYCD